MVVAGIAFAFTSWVPLLILAGAIGVISPTGNEVGPFLAIEQAALSQTIPDSRRTSTFAWYNLVGYVATATGALGAGLLSQALLDGGAAPARRVPGDRHRLRAHRAGDGRRLLAARPGDRGAAARGEHRRDPAPARARSLEEDRPQAVGPVLARRLRRRLHPAEPDGLLVPPRSTGSIRRPSARSSSARTCSPPSRRSWRRRSRRGSACSTRWSSPTSRRTCC